MSCGHANPPGYAFCGTCGETLERVRCRCGFVASAGEAFCGRCGVNLAEIAAGSGSAVVEVGHRFDLESLVRQAAQEKQFLESTHKAHVTQEDIRKLLARRRKKF